MDVFEAVDSRLACRFLDRPVDPAIVRDLEGFE